MTQFFKTHKIIFWALAFVFFGAAAWGTTLLHQKKIEKEKAPSPALNAVQQPAGASAWQVYRNEELGFEIQIPQRWAQEYRIEEKKTAESGFGSVIFSKKARWTNKAGDISFSEHMVLGITVATPGWWKMISSSPTDRPTMIIATDQKVYVYRKDQDSNKNDASEISKVISTFKLIP